MSANPDPSKVRIGPAGTAAEGLRLVARRPRALLVWSALWLVMLMASDLIGGVFGGQAFGDFMREARQGRSSSDLLAIWGQFGALMLLLGPLTLFFYAVVSTAAYRLVLDPGERRVIAIGMAELRQAALMVVILVTVIGVDFLALIGLGLATFVASQTHPWLAAAIIALGAAPVQAVVLYVMVRLSLAGPETLAKGRITPFDSWRLTRGRFWPLLGCYGLSFILWLAVFLVGLTVALVIISLVTMGEGGAAAAVSGDTRSFGAYFTPGRVLFLLSGAVLSALTFAIISAPPARIYLELSDAERASGVFGEA